MVAKPFIILLAEDSEHDVRAVERVWQRNNINNPLRIVRDGQECLDYLLRRNQYDDPDSCPRPGVLILDINLPKVDGFKILKEIKQTPGLKRMPVVVLTSSSREEDMAQCYDLGANAYITKPLGIEDLSKALMAFHVFWDMVGLPQDGADDGN